MLSGARWIRVKVEINSRKMWKKDTRLHHDPTRTIPFKVRLLPALYPGIAGGVDGKPWRRRMFDVPDYAHRAARGKAADLAEILANVPAAPPAPGDERE